MGLLDEIAAEKSREVAAFEEAPSPVRPAPWKTRDVVAALARPNGAPLRLIAEIKFRSPSAGPLSRELGPADRALAYERGGAAMVSVLTDSRWFDGSLEDLRAARESVAVPLLWKDFLLHPIQIDHAWAAGADAALLIVRCLRNPDDVDRLVRATLERGLEPFVEVVDERELELALVAGARVIGVNARDLDTLEMDARRAERVLARIPSDRVAVHLSGLKSRADAARIAGSRADAALVGEALMRCANPGELLADLVLGASTAG
jgi:indole-3-glycerol phosphate synthase